MNSVSIQDANKIFEALASDKRISHGFIEGECDFRRELMIGIMLRNHHVPLSALGRVTFIADDKQIIVPDPLSVEEERIYKNTMYSVKQPSSFNKAIWNWHTAPTLKISLPSKDEPLAVVIDPPLFPNGTTSCDNWLQFLKKRTRSTNLLSFLSNIGNLGDNQEVLELFESYKSGNFFPPLEIGSLKLLMYGMVDPKNDWGSIPKLQYEDHITMLINLTKKHNKSLSGEGFLSRIRRFEDWSITPTI